MKNFAFFHPHFLWGLLFLAIALIIHFLKRKHTVVLNFSTLRFLNQTAVKESRLKNLKNLLLLLTRLVIIALLVLIFAQPYQKDDPFRLLGSSSCALYCWVDPTMSMHYRQDNSTLWEKANNMITVLDSIMPEPVPLRIYDGSTNQFTEIRHNEKMGNSFNRYLNPPRHGQSDFTAMIQTFLETKETSTRASILLLFSDFQTKDSTFFQQFFNSQKNPPPTLCINLADDAPWNYSLYNLSLSSGQTHTVQGVVTSCGKDLPASEIVVLVGSMRAAHAGISLKKDDTTTITIPFTYPGAEHYGEVQLLSADPFTQDNTRHFAHQLSSVRILIITNEMEKAFPIKAALQTLAQTYNNWNSPVIKNSQEVLYDDLDSASVILIHGISESTPLLTTLCSVKKPLKQKIIVISPDIEDVSNSWNKQVFHFLESQQQPRVYHTQKPYFPVLPDTVSPLWNGFPRFSDKDVALYSLLSPLPGHILLKTNNNMPFVSYVKDSTACTWIVFATPFGLTMANNLAETGFYIPLLDRLIRYGLAKTQQTIPTWIAGIPAPNPFYGTRTTARIYDATNTCIAQWQNEALVSLTLPGLYKVHPENAAPYWIAAVIDSSEGDCDYSLPEIPSGKKKQIITLSPDSFVQFLEKYRAAGTFDLLWIILIIFAAVEIVLWKREKKSSTSI